MGDHRPSTPSRVMASSAMGLKLEIFGFLLTTRAKTHAKQMCQGSSCHAAFYACLSSHSDHCRCRWHRYLTNHFYFDYWRPPISAPCRNQDGTGSRNACFISMGYTQVWGRRSQHRAESSLHEDYRKCRKLYSLYDLNVAVILMWFWQMLRVCVCGWGCGGVCVRARRSIVCNWDVLVLGGISKKSATSGKKLSNVWLIE